MNIDSNYLIYFKWLPEFWLALTNYNPFNMDCIGRVFMRWAGGPGFNPRKQKYQSRFKMLQDGAMR